MKIQTVASTRSISGSEPPRSTAYYYADLERFKKKEPITDAENHVTAPPLDERSPHCDVVNDGPIREVPPLRDRQWSLPEYHTPENSRKEETYSTAGTFPMPEPREKEPLLAELEIVGRLPLTQLESTAGVRRSRSWYLCCPNVAEEEISRESSWRYSSLRPVTAPPAPGQNGLSTVVTTQSSGRCDTSALRAERDALARALAAERSRAAAAARAHDARLAELHGVIAELVRRRAQDKQSAAIPEEDGSDECESTTQPAGELDLDGDRSRTEQNDTSSALSPELPPPREPNPDNQELPEDTTDTSTQEQLKTDTAPAPSFVLPADTELELLERDDELCLNTARCCQYLRQAGQTNAAQQALSGSGGGSCERERGSPEHGLCAASPGRSEARQAKIASRVRLRRTEDDTSSQMSNDEGWCVDAAEKLALDVCAQADLREALVAASNDAAGALWAARAAAWRARCARLEADCRLAETALARATDTAHRLSCACAIQESSCVSLCSALRAADRALETYDVLLALAETTPGDNAERLAAEQVARQVLRRLEAAPAPALGEPLLSPGPWLQHHATTADAGGWSSAQEARLRAHAARLKADTVALRNLRPPPQLLSVHEIECESGEVAGDSALLDMERAVHAQELLARQETYAAARVLELQSASPPVTAPAVTAPAAPPPVAPAPPPPPLPPTPQDSRRRKPKHRHWLDAAASETDL